MPFLAVDKLYSLDPAVVSSCFTEIDYKTDKMTVFIIKFD
jgi:hypothetical protein